MTVLITASDAFIEDKLEAVCSMDPSAAGGLQDVKVDHVPVAAGARIANLLGAGFEEVHLVAPGLCVHFTDGRVARDWRLTARSLENCLRLRIPFVGQAQYDGSGSRISDLESRCTFIIQPAGASLTGVYREGESYRFCTLNLSQAFLLDHLGLTARDLPRALVLGWEQQETAFGRIELNRAALATAGRFFSLRSQSGWRRTEVTAIALDLLHHIFEIWSDAPTGAAQGVKLRPSEREQLQKLRAAAQACSPRTLSMTRAVALSGLNKNKIHIGFKRVFGMSLHEYSFDLRMQSARRLLIESDMAIVQIAERAGFSEPTNFTAAFRKHFSLLPSEMRRSGQAANTCRAGRADETPPP